MKLLQILQKCLEDWKNISHLDFCLVNLDNTIYISTCDRALPSEEKLEEFKEDEVLCISNMNCRLYKVTESHQLQYVLIVWGNAEAASTIGELAVCQIESLLTAYMEKSDKNVFMQNLLLGSYSEVDAFNRAKKLHITTTVRRAVFLVETKQSKDENALATIRNIFAAKTRDFITAIDDSGIIILRELQPSEDYSDLDDIEFEFVDIDEGSARVNRIIYAVVLALSIVLDIIYIIGSFNNNPFERVAIFHNTDITAHRGASVDAPENTLASFSKAIEDMADVIELDVQMTKDGYIVVMHDTSAYRTTGVLKNITELTLREVKRLDAGYWYSEQYKGEKVPTLEEVLQLAKGKIKLNIEIKTADNSDEVAKKVVKLIQKYSMQDSCVITSFDYSALQAVRSYDEEIEVGYILSVAYGKFYEIDDVDFFSVNASFLTKRVVDAIHNSGKQVYAWTVNNDASIKNLTNKGVDNIITDKPVTAREVIYSRDTSETLINMIKYVFNQ